MKAYIVEEHHEAYFIIRNARRSRNIGDSSTLLHIDEHHDLAECVLDTPFYENRHDLGWALKATYSQLRVSDFILPLIHDGLISRMAWVKRDYGHPPISRAFRVRAIDWGQHTLIQAEASSVERSDFVLETLGLTSALASSYGDSILSIDYDYFSCDNKGGETSRIEITSEAYADFVRNKRHPLRLMFGGRIRTLCLGNRYFLEYYERDGHTQSRLSTNDEIAAEVGLLAEFLERHDVSPSLVILCRSRGSGYTPFEQANVIEGLLLAELNRLFRLSPVHIDDVTKGWDWRD